MLMTSVEGHVAQEQWATLQHAFAQAERPAALRETFLLQDVNDHTLWRTVGVWISREAFEAYRQATPVPGALAMFRAAGSEPKVSLFDIKEHRRD